jgi:DNA-binding LytR/AlgR family response regulator
MRKLDCIIVDDEPIARDILKNYVQRIPMLNLVKSCINATEAYEAIYAGNIDLMFLDIRMPVISGIEFLRSLRHPPAVIFTTAHADFALEGYDLDAVDYLLKPIVFERFSRSVQKVADRMSAEKPAGRQPVGQPDHMFIKVDDQLIRINYDDINYIKAEKDFCMIFLENKRLLVGNQLKFFEETLPEDLFFRIHRSYIVSLKKIQAIKGNVVVAGGEELPVSSSYKNELEKKLGIV